MDLHPIFVHFPIALLTLYGVFELIRFKKLSGNESWFYIKTILLLFGIAGTLAAYLTGNIAESINHPDILLVSKHEMFAKLTIIIFGLLAINYFLIFINKIFSNKIPEKIRGGLWIKILNIREKVYKSPVIIILVLAGLVALTITGAIGGIMVHGPDTDPIAAFVNSLLFK